MSSEPGEFLYRERASVRIRKLGHPDAAQFSVPSKVLSYLSAGRPIVALLPSGNPAAADVEQAGGSLARALAEQWFDISRIADAFEQVLRLAHEAASAPRSSAVRAGAHASPERAAR